MSDNAFLDALAKYRDRFGFPSGSLSPHDPSGNCLMFLAEEMLILKDQKLLRFQDIARFSALVGLCQLSQPGNYSRTPKGCPFSNDQEQQDDFIGLSAASAVIETGHAFQIYTFGRITWFKWWKLRFRFAFPTARTVVDSTTDINAWLGRSPAFVAHLTWAAGKKPNWFYRFAWCWAVAFAGWTNTKAQDPWRISYLMIRARPYFGLFALETYVIKFWAWRLYRSWPGGIPQVRQVYFGDPVHPLAVWMKEAKDGIR